MSHRAAARSTEVESVGQTCLVVYPEDGGADRKPLLQRPLSYDDIYRQQQGEDAHAAATSARGTRPPPAMATARHTGALCRHMLCRCAARLHTRARARSARAHKKSATCAQRRRLEAFPRGCFAARGSGRADGRRCDSRSRSALLRDRHTHCVERARKRHGLRALVPARGRLSNDLMRGARVPVFCSPLCVCSFATRFVVCATVLFGLVCDCLCARSLVAFSLWASNCTAASSRWHALAVSFGQARQR